MSPRESVRPAVFHLGNVCSVDVCSDRAYALGTSDGFCSQLVHLSPCRGGFGVFLAIFALLFAVLSHEAPNFAYIFCCAGLCLYGTSSGLVHGPLEVCVSYASADSDRSPACASTRTVPTRLYLVLKP